MLLTKEDLLAISQLVNSALEPVMARLDSLEGKMDALEGRMDALESKMDALERRVDSLERRVDSLESKFDLLEKRVDLLENDIRKLQYCVRRIEVDLLENNVIPRLGTIEACYTSTYERYKDGAEKIEIAVNDIELLKGVVACHSEKLQKLA